MDPQVGFLVAGVQKGGTTALNDYLAEHPALNLSVQKEPHFFDDDQGVDWSEPDYGRYDAAFRDRPGLRGEATPIYLYWPPCLERIARYNPAMRLILLFRDPVERAWSHWRMEHARGWETEPFGWCIRDGRGRVDDPAAPGCHRVFSYVERGFYAAQLERALARFPEGQVLCLRSQDLEHDPDETLTRVCGFLRIDPLPSPVRPRRANVGVDGARMSEADRDHLAGLYADETARFGRLSGLDVGGWLR
jgi:hypothetical protein